MSVAKTLANFSDTTSEFARTDFIVRQVLNRMATATLVEVMATTADTVDIRPMVAQIDGAGTAVAHGTIHSVPFFSQRAGSSAIIMKPIVGDIGLAIFCHNDISAAKKNKKASNPGSRRRFDWADALYLGGFLGGDPTHYLKFDAAGEIEIKPNTALSVTGAQSVSGNQSTQGNSTVGGSLAVTGPASAATAAPGTSSTQLATTAYTTAALALKQGILSAPGDVPGLAAALSGKQPIDTNLTAIAALMTQTFGRSLLTGADAGAVRTLIGVAASGSDTTYLWRANNLSDLGNVATARTNLGLGTLATQSGTFSGTSSGTNTGDQTTISGNAGTATKLATARNINGVAFDGTAAITINAVDSTARLAIASNLSDLASAVTARTNLGLGTLATQSGTFSGTSSGTNTGDQTRASLGAAASGANSDITSLSGLTTPLSIGQGGTGGVTAAAARTALSVTQTVALGRGAASTAITGTTTETTFSTGTITIPANAMGPNGSVEIIPLWSYTNSANTKTMRVKFGGTAYHTQAATTVAVTQSIVKIQNRNSTSSQVGAPGVNAGVGNFTASVITSAVDTTAPVSLTITGQLTNTSETMTLESVLVRVTYGA